MTKYEPFVATAEDLIWKKLALARVGSDEQVVDLGCGDARVLILAAAEFDACTFVL